VSLARNVFKWGYLDQLKKEAGWRSDEDFNLLNSLFPNPDAGFHPRYGVPGPAEAAKLPL